jgi:SecD/SecF fusion protein
MKSILYIVIAVLIGSVIINGIPISAQKPEKIVTLQYTGRQIDSAAIHKSLVIIENRLNNYGIGNFVMNMLKSGSGIRVIFSDSSSFNEVRALLKAPGLIGFYETWPVEEIIKQIGKDDKLFAWLRVPFFDEQQQKSGSKAFLGSSDASAKEKVDEYITSSSFSQLNNGNLKFAWSYFPSENNTRQLYLLKKTAFLNGNDVSEATGKYDPDTDKADIFISFNTRGKEIWREYTRRNIGKTIAMVVDNKVYYAPKVVSEIKEGKCMISGDFSVKDADLLIAIINSGVLPLQFELIESCERIPRSLLRD